MTDKDRICEMIMHPWPKATDKIQTTHLLLISPHQDLAEQCASYYKRNGEFLKGFEPEREASFFTEKWQSQILRQEMGARRRRVLEKCGFESEGMAKKYLKVNGAWEDHVHMVKRNQAIE